MYGLRRFGIILGLETIERILSVLGNPQDKDSGSRGSAARDRNTMGMSRAGAA